MSEQCPPCSPVQDLTVAVARLSTILERLEPNVCRIENRLQKLERNYQWATGVVAVLATMLGAALPVAIRTLVP